MAAHQAPPSLGFSKQERWSELPCPPPGDRPNPGIKPRSSALWADSLLSEPPGKPKNTEWVAYPYSRRSSQTGNWTGVSCVAGGFFTSWAIGAIQKKFLEWFIWIGNFNKLCLRGFSGNHFFSQNSFPCSKWNIQNYCINFRSMLLKEELTAPPHLFQKIMVSSQ